jgi:mannosyltransferase OCH1-like enzyme
MIEKNIFQSWYTTELHPLLQEKVDYFRNLNPEYEYHLYTDDDMDKFVNENYEGEIANCYNRLNIIVAKVDFWRYLVLYKYGGVYIDMDSSIEYPLKELINDEDDAIITAEDIPNQFVQWGLIFKKNHPILKKVIELIVDNINNNYFPNDIHRTTGPTVYSIAIYEVHKELFNEFIVHSSITSDTDVTRKTNNTSYRIYGKDYNKYFCFKHDVAILLYTDRKHWRLQEMEIPLIKNV